MTHQDAVKGKIIEQYLLGELSGDSRDRFEEHLFDCQLCAADLKSGVTFLEAAQAEWAHPAPAVARVSPLAWLWQPWVLAPALAACLMVIVYQSAVLLPHAKAENPQTASVVEPLVLANAGARGAGTVPQIIISPRGIYLLTVDIPPAPGAAAFRCSLYSPAGAPLWHVDISPAQAHDAVILQVPGSTAVAGINELRVESLSSKGDTLEPLARYRYNLTIAP